MASPLHYNAEATRSREEVVLFAKGLLELCKPRITRMVVITAGLGAIIAPGPVPWASLSVVLGGTALIVAGANAINMFLEAKVDALMERTRSRPIQTGKVTAEVALGFGLTLAVLGYALLARWGNAWSSLLAVGAFLLYAFVYTPMKRHSPYALHVGAVPGAIPPLIGWASASGSLSWLSLSVFAILFVWQLPHFMAIALFRSAEYQRAGIQVYPLVKGVAATERAMVFWSVVLLLMALSPYAMGQVGLGYATVAAALGLSFLGFVAWGRGRWPLERWARTVFALSIPYLVVVLGFLAFAA